MVVSGNASAQKKELRQLSKSGRQDSRIIGQIEKLEWNLDSRDGFGHKRNKKKK